MRQLLLTNLLNFVKMSIIVYIVFEVNVMTLGDLIKDYVEEYSIADFVRDSKISRAYVYQLIENKNTNGSKIVPSIETIKKVSKGLHKDFDEIFNLLDYDFVIKVDGKKRNTVKDQERPEIQKLIKIARKCSPEDINLLIYLFTRLQNK